VRHQLGQAGKPLGIPIDLSGLATTTSENALVRPRPALRLEPQEKPVAEPSPEVAELIQVQCPKHPGQLTIEKCRICSKPICPKCMELFGYVCSPLCKAKADSHGIQLPLYREQKSVKEARTWRNVTWIASTMGALAAVLLGGWFWYAWFGS